MCLQMALSTVSAVLARIGLGKLSWLEPPEPPNRYQRRHPGELLHIDVKSSDASQRAADTATPGADPAATTAKAAAGTTCTCASTTPPAWPTSNCSTTNRRSP
jgi:hypothetical protein